MVRGFGQRSGKGGAGRSMWGAIALTLATATGAIAGGPATPAPERPATCQCACPCAAGQQRPMATPAAAPSAPVRAVPNAPATRSEANQLPLPARFPLPATRLALRDGKVTVRLVNFTNAKVAFEVIGVTGDRLLSGLLNEPDRATSVLELLPTPSNLVLYREDRGFLIARPAVTPQGDLELVLTATPNINEDVNYVNVTPQGEVYLY